MAGIVLTGGPCTGKTTLLGELEKIGYATVPEAARQLLMQKRPRQRKILFRNAIEMGRKIHEIQLDQHKAVTDNHVMDRSPVDPIAYAQAYGKKPTRQMLRTAKEFKADIVFLLEPLKKYQKDSARTEERKEALLLNQHLRNAYAKLGHNIIEVPDMGSAEKRAEFVRKKIEEFRRTKVA